MEIDSNVSNCTRIGWPGDASELPKAGGVVVFFHNKRLVGSYFPTDFLIAFLTSTGVGFCTVHTLFWQCELVLFTFPRAWLRRLGNDAVVGKRARCTRTIRRLHVCKEPAVRR